MALTLILVERLRMNLVPRKTQAKFDSREEESVHK